MIHRRHWAMRFEKLLWITKARPKTVGLYLINTTLPRELGIDACISSRITTGIQVVRDYQINYNWYNEPFAVFKVKELYLDMHGLIFETSVWLLAGSTRSLPSKADRAETWMIHRRHGAMRFEKLLWITKAPPKRVGLYLINTTLPRTVGYWCMY